MKIEDEINKGQYFKDAEENLYLFFPFVNQWRAWKYNKHGCEEIDFDETISILKNKQIESRPGYEVEDIIERIIDESC